MPGAIIGDIVGSIYEWENHKSKDFEFFGRRADFTDDTVCTPALPLQRNLPGDGAGSVDLRAPGDEFRGCDPECDLDRWGFGHGCRDCGGGLAEAMFGIPEELAKLGLAKLPADMGRVLRMAGAEPRWFPAPRAGDIVWCRFPQDKLPKPGPKPRPALVLRVGEAQGHPIVEVAYGTSQKVDSLYAGEFAIAPSDQAACQAAGLSYATKFNLVETFELDFDDTWFSVASGAPYGQTPKLSVLHPSLMRRVYDTNAGRGRA